MFGFFKLSGFRSTCGGPAESLSQHLVGRVKKFFSENTETARKKRVPQSAAVYFRAISTRVSRF